MMSRREHEQSSLTKLSKLSIACWVRALGRNPLTQYSRSRLFSCSVVTRRVMGDSLEKGRKLLERKGPASVAFSCLMATGTVMLTLFTPVIVF